ncbi:hypothetical protein GCM10009785_14520 [Brooklawnia cerclae]|uniref:Uncharacterized protein n=1 Tax=Brooklawnia cerclae TaxID=349934 RepID=A0ABX0SHU2_9ACTN|nr:hypothetical protein [Brooklawnia cerclae]NIH57977.1 hypothetical protein [Brooklawnia cerclae]
MTDEDDAGYFLFATYADSPPASGDALAKHITTVLAECRPQPACQRCGGNEVSLEPRGSDAVAVTVQLHLGPATKPGLATITAELPIDPDAPLHIRLFTVEGVDVV